MVQPRADASGLSRIAQKPLVAARRPEPTRPRHPRHRGAGVSRRPPAGVSRRRPASRARGGHAAGWSAPGHPQQLPGMDRCCRSARWPSRSAGSRTAGRPRLGWRGDGPQGLARAGPRPGAFPRSPPPVSRGWRLRAARRQREQTAPPPRQPAPPPHARAAGQPRRPRRGPRPAPAAGRRPGAGPARPAGARPARARHTPAGAELGWRADTPAPLASPARAAASAAGRDTPARATAGRPRMRGPPPLAGHAGQVPPRRPYPPAASSCCPAGFACSPPLRLGKCSELVVTGLPRDAATLIPASLTE